MLPTVAFYIAVVALAPWLPPSALAWATLATTGLFGFAWQRAGYTRNPVYHATSWCVLHLALLTTGGLDSPLIPAVVVWLALGAIAGDVRTTAAIGVATFALLGLAGAWHRTLDASGLLEGGIAVLGGGLIGQLLERSRGVAIRREQLLDSIQDEVARGRKSVTAEAALRVEGLADAVDRVRTTVGARRAVLWDIDADERRARPRIARGGEPPRSVHLRGSPIQYAWDEMLSLRIEDPPGWATDAARMSVVPLEPKSHTSAVLTLEFDEDHGFPSEPVLDEATAQLRAYLTLQTQQAHTVAIQERFHLLSGVLERLPREVEAEAVATELALSTLQIAGAEGAIVANWDETSGQILAVAGDDVAVPGMTFERLESEMAVAAENAARMNKMRRRGDRRALPVATSDERWAFEPRALLVIPLHAPGHDVNGVLALWRTEPAAFDEEIAAFIEMLAPFAALQLRQSRTLDDLRSDAERDTLTGLANRRAFDTRLAEEIKAFRDDGPPIALLVLDIDHFKATNDRYGHEAGDAVLAAVGTLLQGSVRDDDLAARYGGEEFVLLLPKTGTETAREIAERIRERIEKTPVTWNDQVIDVRVSIGVSVAPIHVEEPTKLFESADAALYEAKETGRNRVVMA